MRGASFGRPLFGHVKRSEEIFMNLYEMLECIRKRPGMWLRSPDIRYLSAFLDGYQTALADQKCESPQLFPLESLRPFHTYTARKYGESAPMGWCSILLKAAGGDKEKAFGLFFEVLEQYKGLRAEQYAYALLTPEHLRYHETHPGRRLLPDGKYLPEDGIPFYRHAKRLCMVTLNQEAGVLFLVEYPEEIRLDEWYRCAEEVQEPVKRNFGTVVWEPAVRETNIRLFKKIVF